MNSPKPYQLDELNKEAGIGGMGKEVVREIPRIDMSNFDARKAEITEQLWQAATQVGFFQLINFDIPASQIDNGFEMAKAFFDLPARQKAQYALAPGSNAGWEFRSQVRPSTGTADQKESYQITRPRMDALWPDEELTNFKATMLELEDATRHLGMQVLSCFATKLGFDEDFFTKLHDPTTPEYQSTLRILHYLPMDDALPADQGLWRAGAHTDFDTLTLLYQLPGQGGLQVCPGKESGELGWTDVEPASGVITCNIGDMLVRWSDDQLLSTLHRVRMPKPEEASGSRYSIAFFCQANKDAVIQGPAKRYPPITAHDYLQQRIAANFAT